MADARRADRVMEDALKSVRLGRVHRRLRVFLEWEAIVGESTAGMARPVSLRAGQLTLRCENSAWADKLKYLEEMFLRRIAEQVGEGVVRRLHFAVGSTHRRPRRRPPAPVPLTTHEKREIRAAFDRTGMDPDDALRRELQNLYERLVERRRRPG